MKKEGIFPNLETDELDMILNYLEIIDIYKEKQVFVGVIPMLNLTAKAQNEIQLLHNLRKVLNKFFEFYQNEKLEKELNRYGWNGFETPSSISVSTELLYSDYKVKQLEFKFISTKKNILPIVDKKFLATLHEGTERKKKK